MSHYYDSDQNSKFFKEEITALIREHDFTFVTGSGVFSVKKVDKGTLLLSDKCIIEDKWDVLDLGCGYGVIGIVVASLFPKCKVTMLDVNKRAILLAKENSNDLDNVIVIRSDLFEKIKGKFNTILVNPPYVAGRNISFQIIEKSKKHLKKEGLLQIVFRHQKGGKVIMDKMKEVFGNVEVIAKKSGYRIYVSKN